MRVHWLGRRTLLAKVNYMALSLTTKDGMKRYWSSMSVHWLERGKRVGMTIHSRSARSTTRRTSSGRKNGVTMLYYTSVVVAKNTKRSVGRITKKKQLMLYNRCNGRGIWTSTQNAFGSTYSNAYYHQDNQSEWIADWTRIRPRLTIALTLWRYSQCYNTG